MYIYVMVDVILLYSSLSGRIINIVVDVGDLFLLLQIQTLLLNESTIVLFKCRMFGYYEGVRSFTYSIEHL